MTDDRAVRALEDVVAVEELAPGLVRVVTWADAYEVDARGDGCRCPDKEYHDTPTCKHEMAALLATSDRYPSPYVDATDAGTPTVMTDGGLVATLDSFEELEYGDKIEYVGPDEFGDEWAAPSDWKMPYTFQHMTHDGTLACITTFKGKKRLAPEHPANNAEYWVKL
jgi:hypothetical protein